MAPSIWEQRFLKLAHKGPEYWRRRLRRFWPLAIGFYVLYLGLVIGVMALLDSDASGAPMGGVILAMLMVYLRSFIGTMLGAAEHLHGRTA